jgi:hypothetical protein
MTRPEMQKPVHVIERGCRRSARWGKYYGVRRRQPPLLNAGWRGFESGSWRCRTPKREASGGIPPVRRKGIPRLRFAPLGMTRLDMQKLVHSSKEDADDLHRWGKYYGVRRRQSPLLNAGWRGLESGSWRCRTPKREASGGMRRFVGRGSLDFASLRSG